ncbi:MAG: Asp-tRNA(Asn)/Glu-tRNA(Gln) amidotransferase subunit GatB [Clostridiales bacterium]|nr:Asp-tRNA(Asn)/Glu-tRNA(Gln) amidotransferase subunit GatB [Clostridiales bacterium]
MRWETVIGIEIHAELSTKSKIFCGCSTEFGEFPNSNTCPVCIGLPGALPVLNEEVIQLALKAGLALNCKVNFVNKMDRKNYFYPDLPKAYQISQFDLPILYDGYVEFEVDETVKKININRIHLEEDAGKLIHLGEYTCIDYNRGGVALIELVTEPELRSPREAFQFVKAIKSIFEYTEVSDCKMEQGSLRFDANISVREKGQKGLNTKVEIKNLNSFKEMQKALEKEEKRQIELYEFGEGDKIVQETRRWDSAKGRTVSMRGKEEAHDYRYFPEPDLRPIAISKKNVADLKKEIPELPSEKLERLQVQFNLNKKEVKTVVEDKKLSLLFEETVKKGASAEKVLNWIVGDLLRLMKTDEVKGDIPISATALAELINSIENGDISLKIGREIFEEMFATNKMARVIINERGLIQVSSKEELESIVEKIIENNPKSVADYNAGRKQAITYLMGQVMKETKGQANPRLTMQLLEREMKNQISP